MRSYLVPLLLAAGCAHAAITQEEQRILDRLDAGRVLADIRYLSQDVVKTPSGLGAGTAVAGSPEEKALADEISRKLRATGLAVRVEEFPVRAYRYGPVRLTANGSEVPAISLQTAAGTWGRRDGVDYAGGNGDAGHTLTAGLIDAHEGYAADYEKLGGVRGKVVLVHRELRDWPEAQISEAAYRGAAAIVFYDHPNSAGQVDALRQDSVWAHDQIPAVAISRRSAQALTQKLAHGAVEIALQNRADVADGHSQNVIGMIRGTDLADEWVVVGAHYDRWFQGAGDNTSGAAAVLELARAFAGSGLHPRRSMLFMTTGSEEAGLEDAERDWLAGSHAFVARHPEVLRSAALMFNLDLIGWTAPAGTLMSTPDIAGQQRQVLTDLGYEKKLSITIPTTSAIDAWNYGVVGGAAMNHLWRATSTGNPAYFPIYHTQLDTFDPRLFGNMQMDLRLLGVSLWRAATVARLPIALTAVADYVGPLFSADAARVPEVDFRGLQAALADFRRAAAAAEAAPSDDAQRLLMSVRHTLVPWLYISNGDFEQAVRTNEDAQRVAVLDKVAVALRSEDRKGAAGALAGLYEGRQCLRLSPAVYAEETAFWVAEGGWATQFQHRPLPPPPAFAAGCVAMATDAKAAVGDFAMARAVAVEGVRQSVALVTGKLRAATAQLQRKN
ncbi:MAG TPA: M28 family peptidase [Steroidobacteraceae bacterium]|nr:M28 family peptidase [Steroidobacteraceae bacterium]